jgi:hypothetical protein
MIVFPTTAPSPIPIGTVDEWGRVWDGVTWRCPVGIAEAPADGQIYGRQDQTWQLAVAAVNGEATNLTVDGTLNANDATIATTLNAADVYVANSLTAGQVGVDSVVNANRIFAQPFAGTNRVMVVATPYSFGFWNDGDNMIFGYGDSSGNVGSIYVPNGVMFLGQTGNLDIQGTLTQGSDAKTKRGIRDTHEGLASIRALRARRFTRSDGDEHVGLIAQDVQKHIPDAVRMMPNDILGIDAMSLIAVLINAVNELADQVEQLKRRE